jgi:Mn2+/Fe2+ NRAMP family transporter
MLYFSILYAIIPLGILYFFNDHGYLEILQIVTFCMCLLLLIFIFMVLFLTKKEII